MAAPIVPGLTDHEIPGIVAAAAAAGARTAAFIPLRLPYGVKDLFEQWLGVHFPDRKDKVLNRVRAIRGGKLNDPRFGDRMRGEGIFAEQMRAVFDVACRKVGTNTERFSLSTARFRVPAAPGGQMGLFED